MVKRKRLRDNKQQGMKRRMTGARKPMSKEQKLANKLAREKQSAEQKKINEARKK